MAMHDSFFLHSSAVPDVGSSASGEGSSDPAGSPGGAGPTVLVVDDERAIVESLTKIFEREGHRVVSAGNGKEALEQLRKHRVNVILTDLMMPEMNGVDLLRACKAMSPEVEVLVMTAYGTVEAAVEAMKQGAYDFVAKPIKRHDIVKAVRLALEKQSLIVENQKLRAELDKVQRRSIVGNSPAMRRTTEVIRQASPSQATVLLLGESGTGKELLARAIHDQSPRAQKAFVPVNCAAIPETILEAELFGYEKGAFTGAVQRRDGRFLQADGGTLFLDEIGELSPAVQVKLLRVLQDGDVERLGGKIVRVDIRLVAATNKDLAREVKEGRFREDLYYRLNVIAVAVPGLRERHGDVPLLADHFLQLYAKKNKKAVAGFTRQAMELLSDYAWPGNVRELENAIERAVVLTKDSVITAEDLPKEIAQSERKNRELMITIGTPLEEIERRVIHETLRHTRGDKRLAAQLLGIATRTIYRKLESEKPEGSTGEGSVDESMETPAVEAPGTGAAVDGGRKALGWNGTRTSYPGELG
jgi:two-component system response regulator HydG